MRRIGLFFSSDDCQAGAPLDVERLAERFSGSVDSVRVFPSFNRRATRSEMTGLVRDHGLEGVVLAGRSPDHHAATLGGTSLVDGLVRAGVNPNLVVHANLAEHCSLGNDGADWAVLNRKARVLTEVAVLDARSRHAVETVEVPPRRRVLVIGSGAAAVVSAYRLTGRGLRVLVSSLSDGWIWREAYRAHLDPAAAALENHEDATVAFGTEVRSVTGWAGDYEVTLRDADGERTERCGGIVVAVGRDFERYRALWPILQLDSDEEHRPLSRNRHTMSVRSTTDGVVIIQPAREADGSEEYLRQQTVDAAAAALELRSLLYQPWLTHEVAVSEVDPADCGLCRTCIKVCAFSACTIDDRAGTSTVDQRLCKACGNCVVACPAGARDLVAGPTRYLTRAIDLLAAERLNGAAHVLAFLCAGCAYRAVDMAANEGHRYPVNVLPLRVQCGGRVDMQHVLQAFQAGFDGVVIGTCREGNCHNIVGHLYLDRRVVLFRDLLRSRGIDPERLRIMDISPHEGELCAETLHEFVVGLGNGSSGGS